MNAFQFGFLVKVALNAEFDPTGSSRPGRYGSRLPPRLTGGPAEAVPQDSVPRPPAQSSLQALTPEAAPRGSLPRPPAPALEARSVVSPQGRPQSWPAGGIFAAGPFANPAYRHPQTAPALRGAVWGDTTNRTSPGDVPYPIRGAGRVGSVPALSPSDVFAPYRAGSK